MRSQLLLLICAIFVGGCKNERQNRIQEITPAVSKLEKTSSKEKLKILPISHASMLLKINAQNIYVDPVGQLKTYKEMEPADFILLTHAHPDHFNLEILQILSNDSTKIIAPKAVAELLPETLLKKTTILLNGESLKIGGINITAVPMYNMREEAQQFHPKGDGNGYILDNSETKIYIAGDSGPIPEMRKLKNIDIAFIPMNLPYTMSVADAADAVLDFKPKKVYPYHYRGKNGFSDVQEFKNIVNTNDPTIEVIQLDWYPEK